MARAHGVDLERIAALQPDLFAVWGSGFAPAVIEALRRLGTPVFVSEPKSLADFAGSIERLGALAAGADAGAVAAAFRARLDALRAVRAGWLVPLDADRINRHTPRLLEEPAVLCERIDQARSSP